MRKNNRLVRKCVEPNHTKLMSRLFELVQGLSCLIGRIASKNKLALGLRVFFAERIKSVESAL